MLFLSLLALSADAASFVVSAPLNYLIFTILAFVVAFMRFFYAVNVYFHQFWSTFGRKIKILRYLFLYLLKMATARIFAIQSATSRQQVSRTVNVAFCFSKIAITTGAITTTRLTNQSSLAR